MAGVSFDTAVRPNIACGIGIGYPNGFGRVGRHESHDSIEQFVCSLPLAYFRFDPHDRYAKSTQYEMNTLFRIFVLKAVVETGRLNAYDSSPLCSVVQSWSIGLLMIWKTSLAR